MSVKIETTCQPTLLLIISCLLCFSSISQTKEQTLKKIYLQSAVGASTQNGIFAELGIQAALKNNWITTLSYHSIEMDPKNLPSNYEQGYTIIFIFPIYDEYPSIKMNVISFTGGKYFEAGRKIWFTTEAGLSIVTGENYTFTPQPKVQTFLYSSSNYTCTKEKKTTLGGMLKADFNWAFTRYVGLGAGVFGNFSSIQTPIGFQVKLIAGWLNDKKKHS